MDGVLGHDSALVMLNLAEMIFVMNHTPTQDQSLDQQFNVLPLDHVYYMIFLTEYIFKFMSPLSLEFDPCLHFCVFCVKVEWGSLLQSWRPTVKSGRSLAAPRATMNTSISKIILDHYVL